MPALVRQHQAGRAVRAAGGRGSDPADGAPGGIRTHDPQLRKLVLYPLSYGRTMCDLAEREGFEPSVELPPRRFSKPLH
jgi:hypothetical protein